MAHEEEKKRGGGLFGSIGTLLGAGAGFALGGPMGASIGAGIGGSFDQSQAQGRASRAQLAAGHRAEAIQREMYQQTRADLSPYRQAGAIGLRDLTRGLGYELPAAAQTIADPMRSQADIAQSNLPPMPADVQKRFEDLRSRVNDPNTPAHEKSALQSMLSKYEHAAQSKYNMSAEADPMLRMSGFQQKMTGGVAAPQGAQPGQEGYKMPESQMELGAFNKQFTADDLQTDPGYQFRMQEGQKALERSASARGGIRGGGTLKALTRFGQGFGAQEFGAARNRFEQDKANRYNRLASLSGIGQQSTAQFAGMTQNLGQNLAENQLGMGNVQAAGQIAGQNAIGVTGRIECLCTI